MRNTFPIIKKFIIFGLDLSGIALILGGISLDLFKDGSYFGIGNLQIIITAVGFGLTLIGSFISAPRVGWKAHLLPKSPSLVAFILSIVLLIINLIGIILPARNPAVYEGLTFAGKERTPQYSAEEVYVQMDKNTAASEQDQDYAKRLTQLIFDGTVHYWEENAPPAYNLRMRLTENYLIYFSYLREGISDNYEFCRAERAIERAATVCSQSSKILANILARNDIPAHIVGLEGHVVTRALIDKASDTWWILDADYGVVIEHDIGDIESNPQLIREAYAAQGYRENFIDTLVGIYDPEDNQTIGKYHFCEWEDYFYQLKWWLPVLGLIPFPVFVLVIRLRRKIM
jgi:hypothetical protein